MDVHVSQEQDLIPIATDSVVALITEFLKFSNLNFDEVSIYFVDTPTICEMHKQFFDDPTTTDCISFPMDSAEDEGYRVMGDVFVCPETAHSYVATDGGNVYKEITLYVVHGLLPHAVDQLQQPLRIKRFGQPARCASLFGFGF